MEERVQAGLANFIEVGEALATIRDERLYRATHATFEDYCQTRWGMKRAHANRLITASTVLAPMGSKAGETVTNERQARELSKVEPAKRQDVITRARQLTGGKVTAAAIQTAAKPILAPAPECFIFGNLPALDSSSTRLVATPPPSSPAPTPEAPPAPAEPPPPWSLPAWGDKLRAYIARLVEEAPAASRAEAKWLGRQIAADLFAESPSDPKPEPWGDRKVIPPLPEWVTAYSASIGYPMDGQMWCDQYQTKGWAVGKVKMKDWQSACRNWKTNGWGMGTITLAKVVKKGGSGVDYSKDPFSM